MRIRLLCVGKPRDPLLARLHDRYAERIGHLGARYEAAAVPGVTQSGNRTDDEVLRREARALSDKLDGRGRVVALDRAGRSQTSEELARRLSDWATPRVTLVVGGPLGLHDDLLGRADWRWSLSALTFPHELVRVLVAEQLYRALSILRGSPYHK